MHRDGLINLNDPTKSMIDDQFRFEKLFDQLLDTEGAAFAMCDELTSLFEISIKKVGSANDRKTMLMLNCGGSWMRATKISS